LNPQHGRWQQSREYYSIAVFDPQCLQLPTGQINLHSAPRLGSQVCKEYQNQTCESISQPCSGQTGDVPANSVPPNCGILWSFLRGRQPMLWLSPTLIPNISPDAPLAPGNCLIMRQPHHLSSGQGCSSKDRSCSPLQGKQLRPLPPALPSSSLLSSPLRAVKSLSSLQGEVPGSQLHWLQPPARRCIHKSTCWHAATFPQPLACAAPWLPQQP